MEWSERFKKEQEPDLEQVAEYIGSPLWRELCGFLETNYEIRPKVEYGTCSGAPGWNLKYRKSGRALCTLYPNRGFFTCLICIGPKEEMEAELVLTLCCPYTRELYQKSRPMNATRWLMLDITSEDVLEDAKRLLSVRAKQKGKQA